MLQSIAIKISDAIISLIPQPKPSQGELQNCKIISHRGEHNRNSIPENSMQAFQAAVDCGVWGLETDIRWTADLIPMVIHDPDTKRVFGKSLTIADVKFDQLRDAIPEIPTLAEFIEQYGGRIHLMIELKSEKFPDITRQQQILREHLSGLQPRRDYHMLALQPSLFETFDIQPRDCCLPVAFTNFRRLSKIALECGYGGLSGHYVLLGRSIQRKHESAGQKIGTGFVASRNCLFREVNRKVEWIFTNDAAHLLRIARE